MKSRKIEGRVSEGERRAELTRFIGMFEIALIVLGMVAFAHSVGSVFSLSNPPKDEKLERSYEQALEKIMEKKSEEVRVKIARVLEILLGRNFASAQTPGSSQERQNAIRALAEQYGVSAGEASVMLDAMLSNGVLSPSDLGNSEAVLSAADRFGQSLAENLESNGQRGTDIGQVVTNTLRSGSSNGIFPSIRSFDKNDAQEAFDSTIGGIKTCVKTKDGETCQEMTANDCDSLCDGECLDGGLSQQPADSPCKLGWCVDSENGACMPATPQILCDEQVRGEFHSSASSVPPFCARGCCMASNQPMFISQRECENFAEANGMIFGETVTFDPSITTETECLALAGSETEGACVAKFEPDGQRDCTRMTQTDCQALGSDWEFHPNKLCSSPELGTRCERQTNVSCVDGYDEVYWLDSCGNRENIFEGKSESAKESAWNNGEIKPKEQSCELGTPDNPLANQATCGNCNRFVSSICGEETQGQELDDDPDSGVVCRDIGCVDASGKRRENGESWCAYQTQIGFPGIPEQNGQPPIDVAGMFFPGGNLLSQIPQQFVVHTTDLPGSSHFLKKCEFGEITTEACGSGRSQICVQSEGSSSTSSKKFSEASCIANPWSRCFNYNPSLIASQIIGRAGPAANLIVKARLLATCAKDPACFIKTVNLKKSGQDSFEVSYCAPRYPPGFELRKPESGRMICGQATTRCRVVFLHKISGWACVANCNCVDGDNPGSATPSPQFVAVMNSFCTSLGDCGLKANYVGQLPGSPGFVTGIMKGGGQAQMAVMQMLTSGGTPLGGGLGGGALGGAPGSTGAGGGSDPLGFLSMMLLGGPKSLKSILNIQVGLSALSSIADSEPLPGEYIKAEDFANFKAAEANQGVGLTSSGFLNGMSGFGGFGGLMPLFGQFFGRGGGSYTPPDISSGPIAVGGIAGISGYMIGKLAFTHSTTYALLGQVTAGLPIATKTAIANAVLPVSSAAPLLQFSGALTVGGLSAALTGFLIKATGIGPGLGKGLSYGLMTAAGISGAIVGFAGASAFAGTLAAGGSLAAAFGAGAGAGCAVPPACIVIIAIIVFIIIMKMMGVGDIEKKDVLFACLPWTPPVRGDCESCGKDKLSDGSEEFPCNKYACEALGQNCKFVEGSENETGGLCISVDVSDTNAPVITELIEDDLPNGFSYESFRGKGDTEFNIVRDDGTCMSQFDTLTFGFKLDEKAKQCYIGLDPSATKEQMAPIGGGTDKFRVAFTPTAYADFVSNLPLGETSEVQLYIVCEDYSPNANDNENNKYIVNFCINRRDISVPILRRPDLLEQEEQRLHPFDTSEYLVTFELTKMPAECRWDERDTAFDLMQNELDISQCRETSGGADCTWTFPASSSGSTTTICVKCKTDESGVGANVQCLSPDGQPLNLEKSTQLPTIDSFSIDMGGTSFEDGATITVGTGPTEYTVSVTTSGNNPMTCEIQLDNTGSDVMASSDGINHEYTYTDLAEGQHTITVTCTDTAGDSVSEQVSFNVEVDTQLVNIARVYIESGTLYVVTDDPASCSYATAPAPDSANACAFAVDEGTPMSTDLDGTTHSLSISEDETYYIKCKDNFGNERTGTCDIIVSKGKF